MLRSLWILTACVLAFVGLGAPTLSGSPPWTVEHVVLSSTTDWVVYTAPSWARSCFVQNKHASGAAYVGRYNETGTFDSTNDEYLTLPAGAAITIPLAQGAAAAPTAHLAIPVASATASLTVGFYCTVTP